MNPNELIVDLADYCHRQFAPDRRPEIDLAVEGETIRARVKVRGRWLGWRLMTKLSTGVISEWLARQGWERVKYYEQGEDEAMALFREARR